MSFIDFFRNLLLPSTLAVLLLAGSHAPLRADEPAEPSPVADADSESSDDEYPLELTPEAEALAARLSQELAEGSEARAMFDAILQGERMRAGIGWFAMATSQTQHGWDRTVQRLDADGDGEIDAREFPGDAKLFKSVDRDGNGRITAADFDWNQPADTGSNQPADQAKRKRKTNLSRDVLIKGLARQEIGSLQPGPNVGERAEDFSLLTHDGNHQVRLSETLGDQPVVLVFGNFTCGPFRRQAEGVREVYDRYRDQARFLMIYVREAHPIDGWHMEQGGEQYAIAQPQTLAARSEVASVCRKEIDFEMPFLVDDLDDRVGTAYSGMPSRLYVLDKQGNVVFKSGRGPFGFKPDELEQALALHLAEETLTER